MQRITETIGGVRFEGNINTDHAAEGGTHIGRALAALRDSGIGFTAQLPEPVGVVYISPKDMAALADNHNNTGPNSREVMLAGMIRDGYPKLSGADAASAARLMLAYLDRFDRADARQALREQQRSGHPSELTIRFDRDPQSGLGTAIFEGFQPLPTSVRPPSDRVGVSAAHPSVTETNPARQTHDTLVRLTHANMGLEVRAGDQRIELSPAALIQIQATYANALRQHRNPEQAATAQLYDELRHMFPQGEQAGLREIATHIFNAISAIPPDQTPRSVDLAPATAAAAGNSVRSVYDNVTRLANTNGNLEIRGADQSVVLDHPALRAIQAAFINAQQQHTDPQRDATTQIYNELHRMNPVGREPELRRMASDLYNALAAIPSDQTPSRIDFAGHPLPVPAATTDNPVRRTYDNVTRLANAGGSLQLRTGDQAIVLDHPALRAIQAAFINAQQQHTDPQQDALTQIYNELRRMNPGAREQELRQLAAQVYSALATLPPDQTPAELELGRPPADASRLAYDNVTRLANAGRDLELRAGDQHIVFGEPALRAIQTAFTRAVSNGRDPEQEATAQIASEYRRLHPTADRETALEIARHIYSTLREIPSNQTPNRVEIN